MRTWTRRFWAACPALIFVLLSACADDEGLDGVKFETPKTAISYDVVLEGLPNPEMQALGEDSLETFRRQEDGAQSLAFLKRRAEGDTDLLKKLLRSRGYFRGEIDAKVVRGEGEAPALVRFDVDPGPAFTLQRHTFRRGDGSVLPTLDAGDLGSPVGAAARADAIVAAEAAAIQRLQATGFPYAETGKRRAVADLETTSLDIDTPIDTGPAAVFGDIRFSGLKDVRERYLRTYVPWKQGETFDLRMLRTYQRALLGTDLFETVTVKPPSDPPKGAAPVALAVEVVLSERPVRTVSAGAQYSTDDGPSVRGGFEHRNLFGENETLALEAEAGLQLQRIGIGYREPQYMRPGQDLLAGLEMLREEDDAFDELSVTATLGLQRRLNADWLVGAGGLLEASQITDQGTESTAFLAGLPLFAAFDDTNDELDPSAGLRLRLDVVPYAGSFDNQFAGFLAVDGTAATYYDLFDDRRYILAGRGRFGSILTDDLSTVPQTRRLYAGGGGSVRGFAQRFVGPLDTLNDPTGGLSAVELGAELRARLYGDLGGTLFLEAGSVSEQSFPDFNTGVQVAAGVGFRYYSPAGPIRVDVALPLNPRDADDAFQLYFSIGQAF